MFKSITPEQAGISSAAVSKFLSKLHERGLYMHGVLLARGHEIFTEAYWAPFNRDSIHRMYSQTKSFVGIAIGLLEEEGKLSLDDCLSEHFPEKLACPLDPRLSSQTIRQTLTMETTGPSDSWFRNETAVDRTEYYFRTTHSNRHPGMIWEYDSPGSQVLSSLVEKLSGMSLLDYLKSKLFNIMGTFQTARTLKTRNEDTFGDSAMICTLRDVASFGRLLMDGGQWQGQQLIPRNYVEAATSCLVDNDENGFQPEFRRGYGYQIWQAPREGFAFVGMGGQLTVMLPKYDLLFSCIGDNQGYDSAYGLILAALSDFIVDELGESRAADEDKYQALQMQIRGLKLRCLDGEICSPLAQAVNGKQYICEENPMGIEKFSLKFDSTGFGRFCYTNSQGDKSLEFGIGKNAFGKFPQLGYALDHACIPQGGDFKYDCATSAAWREPGKLVMKVQIIDLYLGSLFIIFSFRENMACVRMWKRAEAFLEEYQGTLTAWCE